MKTDKIIQIAIVAGGGYLLYTYLKQSGLWDQWFGAHAAALPAAGTPATTGTPQVVENGRGDIPAPPTATPPPPTFTTNIDVGGLVVAPDISHSLTGWVNKITGNPNGAQSIERIRLSVIVPDGRIFDQFGTDITAQLQAAGVNVQALRTAFYNAPRGTVPTVDPGYATTYPDLMTPAAGVSGLGAVIPVPNAGPITAPIAPPSMSFGNSKWGGGGYSAGFRGRGNRGVQ